MTPSQFIRRFELDGKTILETGTLYGEQTVQLCRAGARVITVDIRRSYANKAVEFADANGGDISFVQADLETYTFPDVDACWHSGTLYHLTKPREHLFRNLPKIRKAIYLSTHYSENHREHWHRESVGPKAGLSNKSLWLPKEEIINIVHSEFGHVEVIDARIERHGPRMELVAWR